MNRYAEVISLLDAAGAVTTDKFAIVTKEQAKQFIQILASDTSQDDLIEAFITASEEDIEKLSAVRLRRSTIKINFSVNIPYITPAGQYIVSTNIYPIQSVESVKFFSAEDEETITTDELDAIVTLRSQLLIPCSTVRKYFPHQTIEVCLTGGYTALTDIPSTIRVQLLTSIGTKYDYRDPDNAKLARREAGLREALSEYQ